MQLHPFIANDNWPTNYLLTCLPPVNLFPPRFETFSTPGGITMPTITGVTWPIVAGRTGLYTDGTASLIHVNGNGVTPGLAVTVTKTGTGTWAGTLNDANSSLLTFTRGTGVGGTEDVTVTVGSGLNKSPDFPTKAPIGGST
jgi:hypothetical protein